MKAYGVRAALPETAVEGRARACHQGRSPSAFAVKIDHAALTGAAARDAAPDTRRCWAKVTDDIGRRRTFNTAIAAVMELMNELARFEDDSEGGRAVRREALQIVVLTLCADRAARLSRVFGRH